MKLLTLLVFASWALAAGLQAQTPDVLVRNGRDALSRSNLVEADKQFGAALRQNPYHAEANVLQAGTRLLLLPQQTSVSNFLTRLGVSRTGRQIYNWTADFKKDTNHDLVLPATVNSSEAVALVKSQMLPALLASGTNLARITNTAFELRLSGSECFGETVAVDYGDVQLLRAFLYAGEFLSYTVNAHNFNVVLNRLLQLEKTDALSFQRLLSENPSLLAKGGAADLGASKKALLRAIDCYNAASEFIRNRASQDEQLFALDEGDWSREADFRDTLNSIRDSLDEPVQFGADDDYRVYLGAYFSGAKPLRGLLPKFDDNYYVPYSTPDYTFGGILVGLAPSRVESRLQDKLGRESYEGIYVGESWGQESPDWEWQRRGDFAVIVRTNNQATLISYDSVADRGVFEEFEIENGGHWEFRVGDRNVEGSVYDDSVQGWWWGESGSGNVWGERQSNSDEFTGVAGYYAGTWRLASESGKVHAILGNDGTLLIVLLNSRGEPVGGAKTQLNANGTFAYESASGTLVQGKVTAASWSVAGTLTQGSSKGTLSLTRKAFIPTASTTTAPPVITTQPSDQVVIAGNNATFEVKATSKLPVYYQWYSTNGAPVWRGTAAKLVLQNAQFADAGAFDVVVGNAAGSVTSRVAALTVRPEMVKPAITIAAPKDNQQVSTATVTMQGAATDNSPVGWVQTRVNSQPWQSASGSNTWTALIELNPGTNFVTAKAFDIYTNESAPKTIIVIRTRPLMLFTNGGGKITRTFNENQLIPGKRYTVTATPNAGWLFGMWHGPDIHTSANPLTFTMQEGMELMANFVTNRFLAAKGNYNGLFAPLENGAPKVGATNSGYCNLTLTDKGVASGKLQLAGQSYPFSGAQFDTDGNSQFKVKKGATQFDVSLHLDFFQSPRLVSGSISSGAHWSATLTAYQAESLTNWSGKYTFVLPGDAASSTAPPGDGAGTVSVDPKGVATLKFNLADGTTLSPVTTVARNGYCPVYAALQSGKGLLWGWVQFLPSSNEQKYDITGTNYWIRSATSTAVTSFAVERQFQGARWLTPSATRKIQSWTQGLVQVGGGNLNAATNYLYDVVCQNNKLTVATNPLKLSLAVTTADGSFTATFTHPVTRKSVTGKGVLLQAPNFGGGWFMGTNQGGFIRIEQKPAN